MSPLILDRHLIAVDTSDVSHDDLVGKIMVAWNQEKRVAGFTVDSIRSHRRAGLGSSGVRVGLSRYRIALARRRQGALVDRASTMIFLRQSIHCIPAHLAEMN